MGRGKQLGDIVEIPLPNGQYAYGRVYKEYTIGIYKGFYNSYDEVKPDVEYFRFLGLYRSDLNRLRTVEKKPFENEEEAWAPDQVVIDALTKKGSLYHHGQIFPCTYEECKDLEIVAAWHTYHVVDMLLGDDKWDKYMGRPQDV